MAKRLTQDGTSARGAVAASPTPPDLQPETVLVDASVPAEEATAAYGEQGVGWDYAEPEPGGGEDPELAEQARTLRDRIFGGADDA